MANKVGTKLTSKGEAKLIVLNLTSQKKRITLRRKREALGTSFSFSRTSRHSLPKPKKSDSNLSFKLSNQKSKLSRVYTNSQSHFPLRNSLFLFLCLFSKKNLSFLFFLKSRNGQLLPFLSQLPNGQPLLPFSSFLL